MFFSVPALPFGASAFFGLFWLDVVTAIAGLYQA
ncbi:hypothetical protein J3E64_004157 [Sphingobium sp. OAS761]|nr:hypothetical protein [Sphingobium sp. OAS761]